jgi:hypothetical protein
VPAWSNTVKRRARRKRLAVRKAGEAAAHLRPVIVLNPYVLDDPRHTLWAEGYHFSLMRTASPEP